MISPESTFSDIRCVARRFIPANTRIILMPVSSAITNVQLNQSFSTASSTFWDENVMF
jgi:hypothetical protein